MTKDGKSGFPDRMLRALRVVLAVGAGLYVLVYLCVAILHMGYPYELEWNEGRMVDHVGRILEGKKIYVPYSLDFEPMPYAPVYFYVAAAASKILGLGFIPLRLVSFLASLGSFALIFLILLRETKSRYSAFLGVCLFAATYQVCGGYFDVGRVDSLLLLFLLGALFTTRFFNSWPAVALAALLFSLAMMTKQTAFFITVAVLPFCILRDWKKGLALTGGIGILMILSLGLMDWAHDGWYIRLSFGASTEHALRTGHVFVFWLHDVAAPLLPAFLLGLAYLGAKRVWRDWNPTLFYALAFLGMLTAGWIGKWSVGGDTNALLPSHAAIAILFGLGFHHFLESGDAKGRRRLGQIVLMVLCIFQFAHLAYNPRSFIPTREDREAGEHLIETMRGYEGEVWLAYHGFLPSLAGKKTFAPAYDYHALKPQRPDQIALREEIRSALKEQRFDAIFLNSDLAPDEFLPYYKPVGRIFALPDSFYPVIGYKTRPKIILEPRSASDGDNN